MSPRQDDARTDQQLIDAINQGDQIAFESLYLRHRDWVINTAYRMTYDRDLAMDVMQETFSYLLGKFPNFTLTCKLTTFLYPAIRNIAITHRRKRDRLNLIDTNDLEQAASDPTSPAADDRDELSAILAQLPQSHQEVLLLRFVDDLSLAEIAQAMNLPIGTVKSRLHNAIKKLRDNDQLKQKYWPDKSK